jgi:hypothetical protein
VERDAARRAISALLDYAHYKDKNALVSVSDYEANG